MDSLWQKYLASPTAELRNELVVRHALLVELVVGQQQSTSTAVFDRDDLVQAGMLGLIDAIERYDPSRGTRFTRYAKLRIRGAIQDWLRDNDDPHRRRRRRRSSSDATTYRLNGAGDAIPDHERYDPVAAGELREELLHGLSDRDRQIVTLRHCEGLSYREIGARLGISCTQAHHHGVEALEIIRQRLWDVRNELG